MKLTRTTLLLHLIEGQPVPVNWPKTVGYPPPGVVQATELPTKAKGRKKGGPGIPVADASYDCSPEGKRIAKAHRWLFPSKRVEVCGKVGST